MEEEVCLNLKIKNEGRKPEILGLNAKKKYVYIKLPSLKKQIECSHLLAMFGEAKKRCSVSI